MFKSKLLFLGLVATIVLSFGGSNVLAADSKHVPVIYTKTQLEDFKKGKEKTLNLKKDMDSVTSDKSVIADYKETNIEPSSNGNVISNVVMGGGSGSSSEYASSRRGTFYVTTDSASSASSTWAGGHAAMV